MLAHVLSIMVFTPALTALVLLMIPKKVPVHAWIALASTVFVLGLSGWTFFHFPEASGDFEWVEKIEWIRSLGIQYHLGMDGISLTMVILTSALCVLTMTSILKHEKFSTKEFLVAFLVLETAMLGTFLALDVFLFYVFWEALLIPMYYMIGRFGGENRRYATLKFFIYTMAGSVLMLIGMIWLYLMHAEQTGTNSTSLIAYYQLAIEPGAQMILFALFAIAFFIKVPVFPLHTWLPDAHVEAPTPGSIVLAGVLLKMGGYGLIRFVLPLFPTASIAYAPWAAGLGVVGVVYGAYVAWAQKDMKKLVAYSSVSHMGFIVLGIFSLQTTAITGAVFQMVAHGISTGALFLLIGMLYERTHTRQMHDYGGIVAVMPRFTALFFVVILASIGLPGLCGFVGEFLILSSSFEASVLLKPEWMVGISTLGIILGAAYMLSMYDRIFLGKLTFERNRSLKDLTVFETSLAFVPVILAIWLGIMPNILLEKIEPSVQKIQKIAEVNHERTH